MKTIEDFLNEEQDPRTVEKIYGKVLGLLTNDETIEFIAVQKRPAINISPDCVVLTNKRIIFCRPSNLGLSMNFSDFIWKDVADCHMKEEIFGAEFTVRGVKGPTIAIDFLPKAQARKLYQFAQAKEEEQIEVRRDRVLEEKRAAAGAVNVNTALPNQVPEPTIKKDDPMASLQTLKALLESGFVTQEEFEAKRGEIISRL
jgi:hypothetical protein